MKKTTITHYENSMYQPSYLELSKPHSQKRETIQMVSMKIPEYYEVIPDCEFMHEPDYLEPFKQLPQQDEPISLVEDYEVIPDCKLT